MEISKEFISKFADIIAKRYRFIDIPNKPTKQSIISELSGIVNFYKNVEYNENTLQNKQKNIIVKFITNDIILQNKNFGPFQVNINFKIGKGEVKPNETIEVFALDPKPSKISPLVTHPNVKNNKLCIGAGKTQYLLSIRDGRYLDAVEIINRILNSISDDPYVSINNWDGYKCPNCLEIGNYSNCYSCNLSGCNNCKKECTTCLHKNHFGCIQTCEFCNKNKCYQCIILPFNKIEKVHKCLTKYCAYCRNYLLKIDFIDDRCPNCHNINGA